MTVRRDARLGLSTAMLALTLADVITGAGAGGGPHVRALSGLDGADLFNAFVFAPGFTGGVFVGP